MNDNIKQKLSYIHFFKKYLLIIKSIIMKKNLFIGLAVCMVFSMPTYAFNDSPNPLIEKSFKTHFPGGTEPVWEKTDENSDAYHVRFKNDGYDVDAYFSTSGTLIGYGRKVELKQLPLDILKIFNNEYGQSRVINLWEMFKNEQTSYLFGLKNDKHYILIEIQHNGDIIKHKKKNIL
jgi:hypothetical protein